MTSFYLIFEVFKCLINVCCRRMRRATSRSIARIRPSRTLQNGLVLSPTSRMRSDLKATKLSVEELVHWRCQHCGIDGHNTPLVRKGPDGGKVCNLENDYLFLFF